MPSMTEHKDVHPAGVSILSLRTVNAVGLPDEATVFGRLIEIVRYPGTVRSLRGKTGVVPVLSEGHYLRNDASPDNAVA